MLEHTELSEATAPRWPGSQGGSGQANVPRSKLKPRRVWGSTILNGAKRGVRREVDSAKEKKKLRFLHLIERLTEKEEQENEGKRK
jgi:hypothetical protein